MRRVALFGGTFDPVHRAHVLMARRAQERCGLDEVVFLPCWQSPHKGGRPGASGEDRLAMLRLAVEDCPWATVSSWELDRRRTSYSWRTAERWREEVLGPEDALFWILGWDQWDQLEHWARADYLSRLVTFIVFPRLGCVPGPQEGREAVFLPDALEVSATEIRLLSGGDAGLEGLVGERVAAYIRKNALYGHA